MAAKSLLLDIDGVIIRDRLLLNHVNDNCVKYVQSKMPECSNPRLLNKTLYLAHGHTARGLTNTFQVCTKDFNNFVYDKRLIDHLSEIIYSTDFQKEASEIHDLARNGWAVTLFTNAPIEWARPIANAIGDDIFVACPGSDVNQSPLKPEASAFTRFSKHHSHIYVDDSLKNLGTSRWLPNWHPVYFNEGEHEVRPWCPNVSSIWEMCLYVNSVDQWIVDNHEVKNF
jgi:hypothetical protein